MMGLDLIATKNIPQYFQPIGPRADLEVLTLGVQDWRSTKSLLTKFLEKHGVELLTLPRNVAKQTTDFKYQNIVRHGDCGRRSWH